ncbi:enoyl-CoA hydratase/isomerase family protein [Streptomyces sp. NPDC059063]|uniref:enoyl-CoA hydratase/isomerase family protein n=1 Tax=unclassified Streptomyces TaxID=2593676 RepID=UPI0036B703A7
MTTRHRSVPVLSATGDYRADSAALTSYVAAGEERLAELPRKPERDPGRAEEAAAVREAGQAARAAFLHVHAERLYDDLTDGRRAHPSLADLAHAAADAHPGLVPDRAQLRGERALRQADKEGREIEQGLLFWSFLRLPDVGTHLVRSLLRPTRAAEAALPGYLRTGRADLGQVHVERDGPAALVTVRNLPYLNAEDDGTVAALETAVDLVALDDRVRVGVLRGGEMTHPRHAGRRVFNAGVNLSHLYDGRISLVDFMLRRELGYLSKILRGDKPWLALVDGFAIGGGLQQLLVFDEVIAASGGFVSLPALTEGIIPGAANLRLPRFAGSRLTRRLILGDLRIGTDEPEARLFCDHVVKPDEMERTAEASVERLAGSAVVANRRITHEFEEPLDTFRRYMAEYALQQARLLHHPDLVTNLERSWIRRAKRPTPA